MRILCLALVLVFALIGCSDDSETTDAAVDAAVDVAVEAAVEAGQPETSAEASVDDLVVTDTGASDTVSPSDAAGE
jgi:ABC-type enterochelin transport system substrate-binding protein